MRKIPTSTLVVIVLLGVAGLVQSAEKPLVTVSFAGYDKLIADLDMIGQLNGVADLGKGLDVPLRMLTEQYGGRGRGPLALATKKPWGAVLSVDQITTNVYAFLPVTDIRPLLELAKIQTGCDVKEDDDDVYVISLGSNVKYAVRKGNWAHFVDSRVRLANVAANPALLLGDLPQRYDLAVRVSMKNLPPNFRGEIFSRSRESAEVGMTQAAGESEEQFAARINLVDQAIRQLDALLTNVDDVLLGWNIDTKTKKNTYFDIELTARAGTKLAQQCLQVKPGKTDFAALLLPNAALSSNWSGTVSDTQVAQTVLALADLRGWATKQFAKQAPPADKGSSVSRILDDVLGILQKTVKHKPADGALSLVLDPAAATLLAGVAVADGPQLDHRFQQLAEEFQKNNKTAKSVTVCARTCQNVHLYTFSMPTPDHDLVPLVGDTLDVVVGIAGDKLLVAAGRDAAKTLNGAIDRLKSATAEEVPPLRLRLAVTPIAKFLVKVGDNKQIKATAATLAALCERAGDKDHVSIIVMPVPQGVRLRLEVEEGLLKVLGSLGPTMGWMHLGGF